MRKQTQADTPDWMNEEKQRATAQRGQPVNKSFAGKGQGAKQSRTTTKPKTAPVKRVTKGFQVEQSRVRKWDQLVAALKHSQANKKTGPELIDEAIDHLCKKYAKDLTL